MLLNRDCINVLKKIKDNKVDLIFADPPYFLSNNGLTIHSGKIVSVNKGEWDKKENYKDIHLFTKTWIKECYRILKIGGSIWISGTQHNIFDIREALIEMVFRFKTLLFGIKLTLHH